MIVRRLTYKAKLGRVADLIALLKREFDKYPTPYRLLAASMEDPPSE